MRRRTKWLAAAAAGLGPWLPGWLTAAGLDAWNAPALRATVAANLREEARLDGEIAAVDDQIRAKERLAGELIAGRITLAEATAQFEAMVLSTPRMVTGLRCLYPDAATDRERAARHVIDYTRSRLTDADERDRLSVRMTAEMTALFPPAGPPGAGTTG